MTQHRPILALALCLLLALTSQGLAVARGAAQPVGTIVLCTGAGAVSVAVDAGGQPVAPPHICPDCLPGFVLLLSEAPALRAWRAPVGLVKAVEVAPHRITRGLPASVARAPPVEV